MPNTLLKFQLPILFFGIFETRNTANTSPIDHSAFFFLNNLNFLISKSRFYTSSNTKLFVYKLKNAALRRLAARQSISGKPIVAGGRFHFDRSCNDVKYSLRQRVQKC
jgi:hypothetical protein